MVNKTIVLFQKHLRLHDNPALAHAVKRGEVIALYVLEDNKRKTYGLGGASKWWLHHSLLQLQASLAALGVRMLLRRGERLAVISQLLEECGANAVYWNRCYEPYSIKQNEMLKSELQKKSIEAKSFNGGLLFEPWEISNKQGQYFKIFTPFWKHCLAKDGIAEPYAVPTLLHSTGTYTSDHLNEWKLLPTSPDWASGLREMWQPGEDGAHTRLTLFLEERIRHYPDKHNIPADDATSYLSPHLHWGEISPRQVWHAARHYEMREGSGQAIEKFLSELGWREFSYYLLYHFPELPTRPFNAKFNHLDWVEDDNAFKAWQQGKTGYPIVDAGMRELWHTGYMHNRVRMIVASFLTKDLRISWQRGAAWFWDTLVDADLANNSASWQWVAGCGADASPYYRIFNPVLQGNKFDPKGEYVRRWIPELSKCPDKYIHCPWEMDKQFSDYPRPIVDHTKARDIALQAYKKIMKSSDI